MVIPGVYYVKQLNTIFSNLNRYEIIIHIFKLYNVII